MCETLNERTGMGPKTIPIAEAVGTVLAHDITEIRPGEFKGRAFKKGHIIKEEDVYHLQRLGKENLYVLNLAPDEMHEDNAAFALANALMGEGVRLEGPPKEGKINIVAQRDGLLKVNKEALRRFNMLGDVMCATLHDNTVVKKGQVVAGTRAVPLVVKRDVIEEAVRLCEEARGENRNKYSTNALGERRAAPFETILRQTENSRENSCGGIIEVKTLRKPRAGIVITGNEVYYGMIKDAFAPVITKKLQEFGGEVVALSYVPDDVAFIERKLRETLNAGANLLITTGGMSVDPDDVTRFAIRNLGATEVAYGSAVLPGAMFLVAYLESSSASALESFSHIPVIGIPACGIYAKTTVFDLVLPRLLAGEMIGRRELAEFGHGGLCLKCETCRYPVCPFGK